MVDNPNAFDSPAWAGGIEPYPSGVLEAPLYPVLAHKMRRERLIRSYPFNHNTSAKVWCLGIATSFPFNQSVLDEGILRNRLGESDRR